MLDQLNDKTMVDVFKQGTGTVGYYSQLNRVARKWYADNSSKKISIEELKDLLSSLGGRELLTNHLLIKDIDVRVLLDLPVSKEVLLDDQDIKTLLKKNVKELTNVLANTTDTIKDKIVVLAIESKLSDLEKIEKITEYTGVNLLELIKEKKAQEKAAKANQKADIM